MVDCSESSGCRGGPRGHPRVTARAAPIKWKEQSENVDENKATELQGNGLPSPCGAWVVEPGVGQALPLQPQNCGNKARMLMKTKELSCRATACRPLVVCGPSNQGAGQALPLQPQNCGNKARMSMKTKEPGCRATACRPLVERGPSNRGGGQALPPQRQNPGNKARMLMKTKEKDKESRS